MQIEYIINHRYLVRSKDTTITMRSRSIEEWKLLEVSKTSYKFKHEPNMYLGSNQQGKWINKQEFLNAYDVIEDLDYLDPCQWEKLLKKLENEPLIIQDEGKYPKKTIHHWKINNQDFYTTGEEMKWQMQLKGSYDTLIVELIN